MRSFYVGISIPPEKYPDGAYTQTIEITAKGWVDAMYQALLAADDTPAGRLRSITEKK